MLDGITGKRLIAMVPQEHRWVVNLKKAFFESDVSYVEGTTPDHAFPALCKAIDVASTLRLSLLNPTEPWIAPSTKNNKEKFTSFLLLEIPRAEVGGVDLALTDARTHKPIQYDFGGLIYAIRCMVHENESLNAAEKPDYHVTLQWNRSRYGWFGTRQDGRVTCNANALWWRVREVLAKFILGTDMLMGVERGDSTIGIFDPKLKSIYPEDHRHRVANATISI